MIFGLEVIIVVIVDDIIDFEIVFGVVIMWMKLVICDWILLDDDIDEEFNEDFDKDVDDVVGECWVINDFWLVIGWLELMSCLCDVFWCDM